MTSWVFFTGYLTQAPAIMPPKKVIQLKLKEELVIQVNSRWGCLVPGPPFTQSRYRKCHEAGRESLVHRCLPVPSTWPGSEEMPSWSASFGCNHVGVLWSAARGDRSRQVPGLGPRAKRPHETEPLPTSCSRLPSVGPPRRAAHPALLAEGFSRQSPWAKQTPRSPNFPLL